MTKDIEAKIQEAKELFNQIITQKDDHQLNDCIKSMRKILDKNKKYPRKKEIQIKSETAKNSDKNPDFEEIKAKLKTFNSNEEGILYLKEFNFNAQAIKKLAKFLKISLIATKKEQIYEEIAQVKIGYRIGYDGMEIEVPQSNDTNHDDQQQINNDEAENSEDLKSEPSTEITDNEQQ